VELLDKLFGGHVQGFEYAPASFSGCFDDGPERVEVLCTFLGAQAASDFHPDLAHLQVPLGFIAGERRARVRPPLR